MKRNLRFPRYLQAAKAKPSSTKEIPSELNLTGVVEIMAAEAKDGEAKTAPKISLTANSGRPMQVSGFFNPVIMDIAGAKFDKKVTPIIADHDVTRRIGHTTAQTIDPAASRITAEGLASSTTKDALEFVSDAKAGIPFQCSVGASITEGYFVEEGETATVNGKTWKGPLIVAKKSVIRELSVTLLGADSSTTATVAASHYRKDKQMGFEAYVKSLGLDISALSEEQKTSLRAEFDRVQALEAKANANPSGEGGQPTPGTPPVKASASGGTDGNITGQDFTASRKAAAAEEGRIDGIRSIASKYASAEIKAKVEGKEMDLPALKAHAIENGWTQDRMELLVMRAERPNPGPQGPAIHVMNREVNAAALECSILRRFGVPVEERNPLTGRTYGLRAMYGSKADEILEASHASHLQCSTVSGLLDLQIRAAGKYYGGLDRKTPEFMAAAFDAYTAIKASGFSTLNVVNLLENVANKSVFASFEAGEKVWRFICGRRPLTDFKPHSLYTLDFEGSYRKVDRTGELKHISMKDSKKTIQADTYGAMIAIDRQTLRNDDLGEIVAKAVGIGTLAAERIEESVFVTLLGNAGSFFSSGNKNLISGGSSALSVAGLELARAKYRNQVVNGKPVGVSPRILLTGTTLETTANNLYTQEKAVIGGGNTDTGLVFENNPHKGLYRPYVSPYLNNTDIRDQDGAALSNQSDTQWYLFADPNAPQGSALTIGFLDNRETPFFDQAETQFNIPGGIQMRSYLDWGIELHVNQLAVRSAGA